MLRHMRLCLVQVHSPLLCVLLHLLVLMVGILQRTFVIVAPGSSMMRSMRGAAPNTVQTLAAIGGDFDNDKVGSPVEYTDKDNL